MIYLRSDIIYSCGYGHTQKFSIYIQYWASWNISSLQLVDLPGWIIYVNFNFSFASHQHCSDASRILILTTMRVHFFLDRFYCWCSQNFFHCWICLFRGHLVSNDCVALVHMHRRIEFKSINIKSAMDFLSRESIHRNNDDSLCKEKLLFVTYAPGVMHLIKASFIVGIKR